MHKLKSFKDHPGYKELMEIARIQVDERTGHILLAALPSIDAALGQEYMKGEVHGIMLFQRMTDIRIDELEREIEEKLATLENRDESEKPFDDE